MGKVLKYGLFAIILIVLILILVPWLFKGQIFERIKAEANKNLKGELEIADMGLSLFRDFPNLTLTLDGLVYTCDSTFNEVELFNIERLRAELDLVSVFKGDEIKIESIGINGPTINVIIDQEGNANYVIMKEDAEAEEEADTTAEETTFSISLKSFVIENLNLSYDDKQGDMFTTLANGNLNLRGDFSQDETDVTTNTTIDALTFGYEGINYLTKAGIKAAINANYNAITGRITLADNDVWVNNLNLLLDGWMESYDEKVSMDLSFKAPHSEFKEVLSLVPAVYMEGYEDVKTSGRFSLAGLIQGDYFYEGEDFPKFSIASIIKNGSFKYPDLPSSVSDINLNLNINHPGGDLNKMVIDIPTANMVIAGSPFNMRLGIKTPMTDPYIDFAAKTKLNLAKLLEVVPVEGTDLKGILDMDVALKGLTSDFENANIDKVEAQGYFITKDLLVKTESLTEALTIDTLYAAVTPKALSIKPINMRIGTSDFSGSGELKNMVAYALTDDTLTGSFTLASEKINVTELMNALAEEETQSEVAADSTAEVLLIPGNVNLTMTATAGTVVYDDINLQNVSAKLYVQNQMVALKDVLMDMYGGRLAFDGLYSTPEGKPKFDMELNLRNLDAKSSFENLNTVQAFAPVASSAVGSYGGTLKLSSFLDADFMPDLASLSASGSLITMALALQPDVMKAISELVKNPDLQKVRFQDADLSFKIDDGRVKVSPVNILMGGVKAEFSGSHGLDQTMDYRVKTNLPIDKIQLPKELQALNLTKGTIPVEFSITGTLTEPKIKPVFGNAENVQDLVKNVVNQVVEEVKDSAINTINKEAEKIMADARQQADAIMAQAEAEAAKLKAEAKKQADNLKAEARTQADKLLKEAKGDPFKEIAAKAAADQVIKKADKQIDDLNNKANQQADKLVADARKEADRILKEAEEKAKINNQ